MYTEKTFSIPTLHGISEKTIKEHLALYVGYVKNANLISNLLSKGTWEGDGGTYAKSELQRRFAFEWDGMRNHECYFSLLEGVAAPELDSSLVRAIETQWGSLDNWKKEFSQLAVTRGIGWAILYWDPVSRSLVNGWVDEQHVGHLAGCDLIIALDMWEHSYVLDYFPSGKKQYVADFLSQMNWKKAQAHFEAAVQ
ncbi:superoxide dismutase [Candidatus Nomurabacteria bacterium]|nr:superoxide dismutase [Candidatus Nomurabacteria bacterium]